jgi:predicted  nucleic acid-binding Zn-ribbon protein
MKRSQAAELQNQLEINKQKQVNLEDEVIYLETKMDKYKNQIGDLEDELLDAKKNIEHPKRDR